MIVKEQASNVDIKHFRVHISGKVDMQDLSVMFDQHQLVLYLLKENTDWIHVAKVLPNVSFFALTSLNYKEEVKKFQENTNIPYDKIHSLIRDRAKSSIPSIELLDIERTNSVEYIFSTIQIVSILGLQEHGLTKDLILFFASFLSDRVNCALRITKKNKETVDPSFRHKRPISDIPFTPIELEKLSKFKKVTIKISKDEVYVNMER